MAELESCEYFWDILWEVIAKFDFLGPVMKYCTCWMSCNHQSFSSSFPNVLRIALYSCIVFLCCFDNKKTSLTVRHVLCLGYCVLNHRLQTHNVLSMFSDFYMRPKSIKAERWRELKRRVKQSSSHQIGRTEVRQQLGPLPEYRPFFTYIITLVRTCLL